MAEKRKNAPQDDAAMIRDMLLVLSKMEGTGYIFSATQKRLKQKFLAQK